MRKETLNEHSLASVKDRYVGWSAALLRIGIGMRLRLWAIGAMLMALLGAMVSAPAFAKGADADGTPIAFDARIAGDRDVTRFVADLTQAVPIRAFALADPYRVIVDLPEVSFRLDSEKGSEGRGLVRAYRYGLFAPGKSRIVLDVAGPVIIERAFVNRPGNDQPARLVVELHETDAATFEQRMASASEIATYPKSNIAAKSARLTATDTAVADTPSYRPIIVIDPGHGGVDPGARSRGGLHEKEVVLDFGLALRDRLKRSGAFEVVMTRDDDTFVSLDDRVRIARDHQAALFISIHADSFRMRSIRGATVYTQSDRASDAEAAALAERENRADVIAGLHLDEEQDAVTDILLDLVRRETKNLSIMFAREVIEKLDGPTTMNKNPHRFAGFRVLKAPDVPSVLIELGYMSNRDDEKRLRDPKWRDEVAGAIARAVDSYLQPQLAGATQ